MNWFRKVLVAFFAFILLVSVIDIAWSVSINRNFGNAQAVKTWITASKIYDNAVSAVLNSTQDDTDKSGGDGSITLKDPLIQQAAKEAFSPQLLEDSVNTFVDSNFAWLSGKTATPEFRIDLSQAKEDFATNVGAAVQKRLTDLKVCTATEQTTLQIPVNVMTVTCRPASLDPKAEGERVASEIRTSDFLTEPVITADTLAHDKNSATKAYYQKASQLPQIYQAQQKAPLALGLVALLCTLAIIFIASPRRKGWRRIGSVLLVAGILLVVSNFTGNYASNRIERQIGTSKTVVSQLRQPISDLIDRAASEIGQTNMYFGVGYIALALIIYGILLGTRDKNGKKKPAKAFEAPKIRGLDDEQAPAKKPGPTSMDITGAGQKPTGPPVFKNPSSPRPKPKGPKPPRLIQ